jgi:hypothetical protein
VHVYELQVSSSGDDKFLGARVELNSDGVVVVEKRSGAVVELDPRCPATSG